MNQLLFHEILPEGHKLYVSPSTVLEEGITCLTPSNLFYMNLGRKNSEILEKYRPANVPEWLDFGQAIGVGLEQTTSKAFAFPLFTDKIRVFDGGIASLVYDQQFYEECRSSFEEAEDFDTGMTLDELHHMYWESMRSLSEYLATRPYSDPQVLLFEPVPKELLTVVEKDC